MHLYKCKRDVEDYKMLEWPLSYFKYLTSPVKVDKLLSSALDFIDSAVSLRLHTQKSLTFVVVIQFEMVIHFICNVPAVIVTEGGEKRGGG